MDQKNNQPENNLSICPELILTPYKQFWETQKAFIRIDPDVHMDICCYQGGYGSGKTFIGSLLGLLLCWRYPGVRGLVVAKTFPLLRDTTLQTYFEHLQTLGFEAGTDYIWRASEAKLIFPRWGKSEILFRHLEHPGKIKSLNLGWIEVEEMSQITEADFLMLLSRLRQTGVPRYRLFGHTNPEEQKGWIYKYFVKNGGKRKAVLYDNTPIILNYRRLIASATENKALPPGYIENMRAVFTSDYARMNIDGEDAEHYSGLVIKGWDESHVSTTVCYRPDLTLYISCDFNVDPMCWVFAHRLNGEYHFFDEICLENTNIAKTAEIVWNQYRDHQGEIVVTGDATGKNRSAASANPNETFYTILLNRLRQLGARSVRLDVRRQNPPVENRVEAWNAMVVNSKGERRIKVNPACRWLIWNCENLHYIPGTSCIWEPTKSQIEADTTKNLKFTKHVWDAASYLVERYDPIRLDRSRIRQHQNRIVAHPFQIWT